jgi:hypothetical protein
MSTTATTVHYRRAEIAIFPTSIETVFRYMSAGGHKHAAFKSHRLVKKVGNVVSIEAEIYNPDGSTFRTTIEHTLNQPKGVETKMFGGAFDGAAFVHSYTSVGGKTHVDLEGDFPAIPGMSETEELKMIDGFFGMVFGEDAVTLETWS